MNNLSLNSSMIYDRIAWLKKELAGLERRIEGERIQLVLCSYREDRAHRRAFAVLLELREAHENEIANLRDLLAKGVFS